MERKENFGNNLLGIIEHHQLYEMEMVSYKLKPNKFTDQKPEDVIDKLTGLKVPTERLRPLGSHEFAENNEAETAGEVVAMQGDEAEEGAEGQERRKRSIPGRSSSYLTYYPQAPVEKNWCYLHGPVKGKKKRFYVKLFM